MVKRWVLPKNCPKKQIGNGLWENRMVTWPMTLHGPWKVKVVTQIRLEPVSRIQLDMLFSNKWCCGAVWWAILETACFLVIIIVYCLLLFNLVKWLCAGNWQWARCRGLSSLRTRDIWPSLPATQAACLHESRHLQTLNRRRRRRVMVLLMRKRQVRTSQQQQQQQEEDVVCK